MKKSMKVVAVDCILCILDLNIEGYLASTNRR